MAIFFFLGLLFYYAESLSIIPSLSLFLSLSLSLSLSRSLSLSLSLFLAFPWHSFVLFFLLKTFQIIFTSEMVIKLVALDKLFFRQIPLLAEMLITTLSLCELIVSWAGGYDFTGYSLLRLVKLVRVVRHHRPNPKMMVPIV